MTNFEVTSLIISGLGFTATVAVILVAYGRFRKMAQSVEQAVKANSISTLNTVLTVEGQILENRTRLSEASIALAQLKVTSDSGSQVTEADFTIAKLRFDEARESYLNVMDRLCACILRGLIPEEDYRRDYRGGISDIMKQHKDLLGVDTRFRNIIKIYEKWADD